MEPKPINGKLKGIKHESRTRNNDPINSKPTSSGIKLTRNQKPAR